MNRHCFFTVAICASVVAAPKPAMADRDTIEKVGAGTLVVGMFLSVFGMVHGITNNIVISKSDAPTVTHHRAARAGLITSLTALGISALGASIAYAAAEGQGWGGEQWEKIYPIGFVLAFIPALIGAAMGSSGLTNSKSYTRTPTREELEARKARTEQLRREAEEMKREAEAESQEVPQTKTSSAGSKRLPF